MGKGKADLPFLVGCEMECHQFVGITAKVFAVEPDISLGIFDEPPGSRQINTTQIILYRLVFLSKVHKQVTDH